MVIIHQNKLEESRLLKMGVRICPSFWYQMAVSRVLAHGLTIIRVVKREKLSSTIMKNLNKLKLNDSYTVMIVNDSA